MARKRSLPQTHKLDVLLNRYGMRELAKRLGVSPSTIKRWQKTGTPVAGMKGKGRKRQQTRPADAVSRLYKNLSDKTIKPERPKERQREAFKKAQIRRQQLHRSETRRTIPGDAEYYFVEVSATSRKNVLTREAKKKLLRAARDAQADGFLGWWIAKQARDLENRTKKQIGIRGQMVSVGDILRQFPRGRSGASQADGPTNWDQNLSDPAKLRKFGLEPTQYAGEQRIEDLTGRGGMDYLENALEILFQQNLQVYGIPITAVESVALRFRKDLTLENA